MNKLLFILVLCAFFAPITCIAERLDFDGDGVSDIPFIKVQENGTLRWRYRGSRSQKLRTIASLGTLGDHLLLGNWFGEKKPNIGTISSGDGTYITWSLRKTNGEIVSFTHGAIQDLAVGGADFDGDSIVDAATVSKRSGILYWSILLHPGTSSSTPIEIQFGENGDTPFFFRGEAAKDRIAVLRKAADGSLSIICRFIDTNDPQTIQLNRTVHSPVSIFELEHSGVRYLVISEKSSSRTRLYLFRPNGRYARSVLVNGTGDMIAGNFFSRETGGEVAVSKGDTITVVNPFTKKSKIYSLRSSIPVDDININSLSGWEQDERDGSCSALNPNDGYKRGFTWKPNSDTQYFAVAVVPAEYTGKISHFYALKSDGLSVIKEIGLKNCGNPDPAGPRCNYQDRELTGANYKQLYGSIVLKMVLKDGNCYTFNIKDPSKRTD